MKTFNSQNLDVLREEMSEALSLVEDSLGIKITVGNMRYSSNEVDIKVKAVTVYNGEVFNPAADDFLKYCYRYGLKKSDLGKEFTCNGEKFVITGCKPRNRKYPIIADGADGRSYKFTPYTVKNGL